MAIHRYPLDPSSYCSQAPVLTKRMGGMSGQGAGRSSLARPAVLFEIAWENEVDILQEIPDFVSIIFDDPLQRPLTSTPAWKQKKSELLEQSDWSSQIFSKAWPAQKIQGRRRITSTSVSLSLLIQDLAGSVYLRRDNNEVFLILAFASFISSVDAFQAAARPLSRVSFQPRVSALAKGTQDKSQAKMDGGGKPSKSKKKGKGQGNSSGWPSTTGKPSGGGRSNNPSSSSSIPDLKRVEAIIEKKANMINQRLASIDKHLSFISKQAKLQNLAIAIKAIEDPPYDGSKGFFKYWTADVSYKSYHGSEYLVKVILQSFRLDNGMYLPDATLEGIQLHYIDGVPTKESKEQWDESNEAFHDALIEKIHEWTGNKPRITEEDDGQYCI